MKNYIFQITPDAVRCVCEIESKTKIEFSPRNVEFIRVAASDYRDALAGAKAVQQSRIDYMEKIRRDPLQLIGQMG